MPFLSGPNKTKKLNLSYNFGQIDFRCKEIRRRVSLGVVEYAFWDGDPELIELVKPMFQKKIVLWSLDPHPGPVDDIRSLIEPLGVEFFENIIQEQNRCNRMCVCNFKNNLVNYSVSEIYRPKVEVFDRIYVDSKISSDIARADVFLVTSTIPFIDLYMRYNRSIFVVAAIRYPYAIDFDQNKWMSLNTRLTTLMKNKLYIVGANSYYDVEFMHFFLGIRPDYIPSFAGYTGEHYQPVLKSFLYARRTYKLDEFWNNKFEFYYKRVNSTFKIKEFKRAYKSGYEFSDLTKHLGIVHQPYQVFPF